MSHAETIVQYLMGELSPEAATTFEDDLFAGALDGPDLDALSELAIYLRDAAYIGILTVVVSRAEMERVRQRGYRILEVHMRPDQVTVGDLRADFDLMFLEYELDLTGVTRLDCEVCDHQGNPFKRNIDLPFDPVHGVSGFCARELALVGSRENPDGIVTRFLSVEPDGDRVLGEFTSRAILP